jgi:hypothetical protein
MANHCFCCRGQYVGEVRGTGTPSSMGASMLMDCPGVTCPECADAAEWHTAIMAETCGEDEQHCVCVPMLRMACVDRDEQLYRLGDELAEAQLEMARLTAERDTAVEKVREMAKQFDVLAKQVAETEAERDALWCLRDDMRALAESARSLTSLWVLRGGDVVSPPAHELLPVLVAWNESKPPTLGLLWEHPPVRAPMARLFCGGCAQFYREAWEELATRYKERHEVATVSGVWSKRCDDDLALLNTIKDLRVEAVL